MEFYFYIHNYNLINFRSKQRFEVKKNQSLCMSACQAWHHSLLVYINITCWLKLKIYVFYWFLNFLIFLRQFEWDISVSLCRRDFNKRWFERLVSIAKIFWGVKTKFTWDSFISKRIPQPINNATLFVHWIMFFPLLLKKYTRNKNNRFTT